MSDLAVGDIVRSSGEAFRISAVLKRHSDNSVSFKAVGMKHEPQEVLIRIFAHPLSLDMARLKTHTPGVLLYDSVGWGRSRRSSKLKMGRADRVFFSVRSYEGQTLKDVLQSKSRIDPIRTVEQLAVGMQSLHAAKLLHGAVRPSNVVFSNGSATLSDYAIPGTVHERPSPTDVMYDAPEALVDPDSQTTASDVYSFAKVVRAIASHAGELGIGYDEDLLGWLTAECLRTDPRLRPSAETIVDVLEASTGGDLRFDGRIRGLHYSAFAELDARAPAALVHKPELVEAAIQQAVEETVDFSKERAALRFLEFSEAEIIHYIASIAILKLPTNLLGIRKSFARLEAVKIENEPHLELSQTWREAIDATLRAYTVEEQNELRDRYAFLPESDLTTILTPLSKAEVLAEHRSALQLRQSLLSRDAFVTSEHVAAIMSAGCPGITVDEVRLMRDQGHLLSVQDQGNNVYPMFQFDVESGRPHQVIAEVNSAFRDHDPSGFGVLSWWLLPNSHIQGTDPASLLRQVGKASLVTELARRTFVA